MEIPENLSELYAGESCYTNLTAASVLGIFVVFLLGSIFPEGDIVDAAQMIGFVVLLALCWGAIRKANRFQKERLSMFPETKDSNELKISALRFRHLNWFTKWFPASLFLIGLAWSVVLAAEYTVQVGLIVGAAALIVSVTILTVYYRTGIKPAYERVNGPTEKSAFRIMFGR